MNSAIELDVGFPPSLAGQHLLAMFVIMAFWAGTLLCLQWAFAIVQDIISRPVPLRHPLTGGRVVKLIVLFSIMMTTFPRLLLLMLWSEMTPEWRNNVALITWLVLIPWSVFIVFAWYVDRLNRTGEGFHLSRLKVAEMPVAPIKEKTRGALLIALIFVISFATTYIRQEPREAPTDQSHR